MSSAGATVNILTNGDGSTLVTVSGRANFESAVPLREFVKALKAPFEPVEIDLAQCVSMDSTFMGVMSMLGLKGYKSGSKVIVLNAGNSNAALLAGLGVARLFSFEERAAGVACAGAEACGCKPTPQVAAETVLEAHKTLMEADVGNVQRFEQVIDFVEKDLDKLKGANR